MVSKRKRRYDYNHQQVEISGFPKEAKQISRVSVKQRLMDILTSAEKTGKKLRHADIMALLSFSGHANMILRDMVIDGTVKKVKFDCKLCEYFVLVKK